MFGQYLQYWLLTKDGEPIVTQFSALLPVRFDGAAAMLKLLMHDEERTGSELLAWWDGQGAVQVLDWWKDGLLLERATGTRSLATMAREGNDELATRILCETAALLHAPRSTAPPASLIPLQFWFAPLQPGAERLGGILTTSATFADRLIGAQQDIAILHGDLHHDNVLDGEHRGWLAIDPKGLIGERTFDFVNILRNPQNFFGDDPVRLSRQVDVIAQVAGLDRRRLLEWTVAFCGLSAVWMLDSANPSERDLREADGDLALLHAALRLLT